MNAPDPVALASWVACLFFVVAGVNQVLRLLDRTKEQPRPSETYARRDECAAFHRLWQAELARLEGELRLLRDESDKVTVRWEKQLTAVQADIREVNKRINDLPNSLITTLKNTGVIK